MRTPFLVAGNTFVQMVGKGITAIATFIITILIARTYGSSGYGDYTKVITYVSVFYLLADFGVNAIAVGMFGDSAEKQKEVYTSVLVLRVAFSILLMFVALSILSLLPATSTSGDGFSSFVKLAIIFYLPTVLFQSIVISANALFQKQLRYDKSVLAAVIGSVTMLSSVFVLTRLSTFPLFLYPILLVGGAVQAGISLGLTSKFLTIPPDTITKLSHSAKTLFVRSLPLGITLVMNIVHFRADIFILTVMRTTQEVGVYGLATKFFEVPLTIPAFFINALYPVLVAAELEKNKARQEKLVCVSRYLLIASGTVIALAGIFLAPFISYIKDDFAASVLPFRILIALLPLFFLSNLYMWILITKKKNWLLVGIYGFAMLVNVSLNMLMIPRYGVIGAALVTGVSESVVLVLLWRAVGKIEEETVAVAVIPQKK